ncbi:hypothetical protein CDD81_5671 [Ophiocordyceps australis]|uniref:Uncharacterized protein n=1 Tax=Ophiocordyceps australis TaxID=1399860 RepID=A0A2C5X9V9_9HYPO|nr:hypothetical protein CDD81_5671 [Ophiocordyceps australis]
MHASPSFASSAHCKASPDGRLVAILDAEALVIRSTETLQLVSHVDVPVELRREPVCSFLWAPSSTKILVSTATQIYLFSAADKSVHAKVGNPAGGKPSAISFGATDRQIILWCPFGLRLFIIDVSTSSTVSVSNPKFHHASCMARGFAIRPESGHIALVTRTDGKDFVSIHDAETGQLQRAWQPPTLDAQGLFWTANGQWLVLWDTRAQGYQLVLYTPDGQHFRTLKAPPSISSSATLGSSLVELETGIKTCQSSPNGELCAVIYSSKSTVIYNTQSWHQVVQLLHPSVIDTRQSVQVWQEQQLLDAEDKTCSRSFVQSTQMIAPPSISRDSGGSVQSSPASALVAFDASSTLLATRLEDSPGTLWIWHVATGKLSAVLICHSSAVFSWHPQIGELLLATCQEGAQAGSSVVWEPLSLQGPQVVSLPNIKAMSTATGQPQVTWMGTQSDHGQLLFSDTKHYLLVSMADDEADQWHQDYDADEGHEASRLVLDASDDDTSALDDTFSFRSEMPRSGGNES